MIAQNQMELSFEAKTRRHAVARRSRNVSRARWWFAQMHRVVDAAADWHAAPPHQAEQTQLHLAARN